MKDKILKAFEDNKEFENSDDYIKREELIKNEIGNKSKDEIGLFLNDTIKRLIDTPVSERGGLVAITGFYYQMLTVIDYFIQMKQDKWDYIAVELHDDIVAVKGNNIRFIQVKTSNDLICQVSNKPASSMYSRDKKKIKVKDVKNKVEGRVSNSWVDKLILKSKNFKKQDDFSTEFELLTNYIIADSSQIKINNYIDKDNSKLITYNDSLYKRLKEESYIIDENYEEYIKVVYEEMCGEKLEELLSRFYIESKQNALNNIDQYIDSICQRIATEIGGAYISYEDVNWIIGELFARCNVNAKNRSLVITKNDVESLFLEIEAKAMIKVTQLAEDNGTKNIVEEVYASIHNDYKEMKYYNIIENKILEYKQYLIDWINNNGGINKIINRYISASEISNKHIGMSKREKENIIEELIIIPIILIIIYNKDIIYTSTKTLLTKEVNDSENIKISLLRVGKGRIESKIGDIKSMLNNLGMEDILKLTMSKELNIILQGYSDTTFFARRKFEINSTNESDELINEELSIKKVYQVVSLIPGGKMKQWLEEEIEEEIWNENGLKSLWEGMMRGE